jgi:hypothetical protein
VALSKSLHLKPLHRLKAIKARLASNIFNLYIFFWKAFTVRLRFRHAVAHVVCKNLGKLTSSQVRSVLIWRLGLTSISWLVCRVADKLNKIPQNRYYASFFFLLSR